MSRKSEEGLSVAIMGATGLVGGVMLKVLAEQNFPVAELVPVASARSVGKELEFQGRTWKVRSMEDALELAEAGRLQLALFSAGGNVSLEWAPLFAKAGTTVVDNSSAWRMNKDCPLVVAEVNAGAIGPEDRIIANPNCTTMQLVMALKPLHDLFGITRGIVSTYQSITGTGKAAVDQLEAERRGEAGPGIYPHPIDRNCIPHCDVFGPDGYTREEMKVWHETRKILDAPNFQMVCTAVRVPVMGGHSESVYLELDKPFELDEVRDALDQFPGVTVQDDPETELYPMPLYVTGKDDVFVGRIRRDLGRENGLHLWVVADNLRKGAATNAVQIGLALLNQGRWD